jgi:hypothetical protein
MATANTLSLHHLGSGGDGWQEAAVRRMEELGAECFKAQQTIVDDILTLKCPRCKNAFTDWVRQTERAPPQLRTFSGFRPPALCACFLALCCCASLCSRWLLLHESASDKIVPGLLHRTDARLCTVHTQVAVVVSALTASGIAERMPTAA